MKAVRISLLTLALMMGATARSVPTGDNTSNGGIQPIAQAEDGPCYLVNGMWVCP